MGFQGMYERTLKSVLGDRAICKPNRDLFEEFFEYEEYKLKRTNNLSRLDEPSYKTLYGYLLGLKNVNQWFGNKPWKQLTKKDIKSVYDRLEDGEIKNKRGIPFQDRRSYYNKIFSTG